MTISEIFEYCQDVVNKDVHGLPFGPDQFNNLIKFVNMELFQNSYTASRTVSESGGAKLAQVLFDTNDLRNFITMVVLPSSNTSVGGLTTCRATYPVGMEYPMSLWVGGKDIEIVSAYRLARLRSSIINRNFDEHPVAVQMDGYFEVYPNNLVSGDPALVLTYLKRPSVPYYDYCLSSDDIPIFMPVGSYVVYNLIMGCYNLYQDNVGDDTLLAQDVTHEYFAGLTPNPTVEYDSLTVELEWDQSKHLDIANKILERMGVNLRAMEIAQYAISKEGK